MSKLLRLCVFGVLTLALAMLARGEPAPATLPHNNDELAGLMRAKLASSQKVVEGLTAGDFELIRKGALETSKICDATQWHARDDQVYSHYRAELRRTSQKIALLAEEKNLDGAAYSYMHSLTTCINCHQHCRDVLHIAVRTPSSKVALIPSTDEEVGTRQEPVQRR